VSEGRRSTRQSDELARLRQRIDDLDRRIVQLMNERAELTKAVGHEKLALGRSAIRDREREREVLLRVSMANEGPIAQADLLAIYRRVIAAARAVEKRERDRIRPRASERNGSGPDASATEGRDPDGSEFRGSEPPSA